MAKVIDAKIKLKASSTTGQVPTVAPSSDHLDGTWDALDIYVQEPFVNVFDNRFWIRTSDGVMELPFLYTNQQGQYRFSIASGTDTYTAELTPTLSDTGGYGSGGAMFVIQFTNANTGASTINIDGLGAKSIKINGSALSSGNIGAGKTYLLIYDGTNFQILGGAGTGGGITNSAANNYVTKSDGTNVVQSQVYDNGTFVGVGTATQTASSEDFHLKVAGSGGLALMTNAAGTAAEGTYVDTGAIWYGSVSNHPVNLYTNDSGTPNIKLNVDKSNTFYGNIIPSSTNAKDLGSATLNWRDLYISRNIVYEGSTSDDYETTLTVTDPTADRTITLPDNTGTVALTANKLSEFASTTSAELAGVISDETGSGALVFGTAPALLLPTISDSTTTTKTIAFTLSGATAAKTLTLISSHTNNRSITFPDATDTLVGKATTDTLTNKTLLGNVNTIDGAFKSLIILSPANAALTWTNQPNAEQFLNNNNLFAGYNVDLTNYTQCRLNVRLQTGSASANTPKLILKYYTAFSTTLGDYADIGTSEVSVSLTTAGWVTSGWVNLAAGAKADIYIAITGKGGDGAADPDIFRIWTEYK